MVGRVPAFATLMALAAGAAVLDWVAVGTSNRPLEYLAKPSVVTLLVAAAAVIPPSHTDLVDRRWWFVAALGCCLVGDVLLMLPADLFVPGLAAFLGGHLLYIVGFLQPPTPSGGPAFSLSPTGLAVAAVSVVLVEALPATLVLRGVFARGQRGLVVPVLAYMGAIVTMVVLACNVGTTVAAVGAALFLLSDTLLALDRFVKPLRRGPLSVHMTYHVGQGLLVLSLLR